MYIILIKQTLLQTFAVLYHGGTVLKLQNISLLLSTIHQIFGPLETGPSPDFLGLPLRVSHPRLFPAVLFPNRETGEPDGSDVQVIRHIARKFNFTLKYNILLLCKSMCDVSNHCISFSFKATASHGRFDPETGLWTGAIGLITRGEADCAIGNFGFTLSRSGAVQYGLVPTYPEAFRMVFVSPIWPASFGWMGVFQVFQMDAWVGIQVNVEYCAMENAMFFLSFSKASLFTAIAGIALTTACSNHHPPRTDHLVCSALGWIPTPFFGSGFTSPNLGPSSAPSQFMALSCWLLCAAALSYAYTSNLRSMIILPHREMQPNTLKKLVIKFLSIHLFFLEVRSFSGRLKPERLHREGRIFRENPQGNYWTYLHTFMIL